jgi:hypothetical protein
MKLLRILALIVIGFVIVGAAAWWSIQRGTGTLDDGVAMLSDHRQELADIVRIAEVTPDLEVAVIDGKPRCVNTSGGDTRENCPAVLDLMRKAGVNAVVFQRAQGSAMLEGATFELFPGGVTRRAVVGIYGNVSAIPYSPDDVCRTVYPQWRVCPGEVHWM